MRAELLSSRHDVELHTCPPDGRGKFENLNRLLAAHPPEDHDWLIVVDDDVELPRGFLDRFLFLCERFSLQLAQPAHRLNSHAAWPQTRRRAAQRRARDRLRGDRPGDGVRARPPSPPCCPSPSCAWAGASTSTGRRSRASTAGAAASSTRSRSATARRRPRDAYSREAALAEARAFLAERPYLSAARRSARSRPTAAGEQRAPKVAVVAEFYPSRRDPVLGIWAHRQALAARDAGAEVRVLVLHRLVPPRASLAAGARGRRARARRRALREPRRQIARRAAGHLRALRLAAARALLRDRGGRGRRRRSGSPCAACAAPFRSTSSTPTTPCPPATRCAASGRVRALWTCRSSCRCTAATCFYTRGPWPRRRRAGRARPGRRPAGARQQPGHRRAVARPRRGRDARRAPRRRRAGRPALAAPHDGAPRS